MLKKNLIYTGCFFNEKYVDMLDLLFKSILTYGKIDFKITRILVMTDFTLKPKVEKLYKKYKLKGDILILKNITNVFESCCARLQIFRYPALHKYKKIIWLDCDILVINNLSNLLKYEPKEKLYAAREGNTWHQYWGRWLYDYNKVDNPKTPGFTTAILLFNNCNKIKKLFDKINISIDSLVNNKSWDHKSFSLSSACWDQPFIVYNAVISDMYELKLQNIVINNPTVFEGFTIAHFAGGEEREWLGQHLSKYKKMEEYLKICSSNSTPYRSPPKQIALTIHGWDNMSPEFLNPENSSPDNNEIILPTQLIYTGCFFKERYFNLLKLLLKTTKKFGKIDFNTTRFLVFTNNEFKKKIINLYKELDIKGDVMVLDKPIYTTVNHSLSERRRMEASSARLHIFDYPEINKYKKILWLDCDILVSNNLNNIFNIDPKNKLNVAQEGNTKAGYWGRWIWTYKKEKNPESNSFNCGILYFSNCEEIKHLFQETFTFITKDFFRNPEGWVIPSCLEQPFINYFAITKNMHNLILHNIVANHQKTYEGHTIVHFPGENSEKNLQNYLKLLSKIDYKNIPKAPKLPYKSLWVPHNIEL